jgi:hypothetical protein
MATQESTRLQTASKGATPTPAAPAPVRRQIGIVWDGEWPAVKEAVGATRRVVQGAYGLLHRAFYLPGAADAVSGGLHFVDDRVHRGSLYVAQYLERTSPWLPAASAVVGTALVVSVKSAHYWGPVAAARNGAVALAAGAVLAFPMEIRDAVFGPVLSGNGGAAS